MKSAWAVGLLSVVPGLGFLAIGQRRRGAVILGCFAALAALYLLAPWQIVYELSCGLGAALWAAQIVFAVTEVRRQARLEAGLTQAARPVADSLAPPPGASRADRVLHKAREAIAQQLQQGERVEAAITCQVMPSFRSRMLLGAAAFATMRVLHIGIAAGNLVILELDMMGRPAELRRHPRSAVRVLKSKQGLLTDQLVLDLGEARPVRLQVGRLFRSGTRQLLDALPG